MKNLLDVAALNYRAAKKYDATEAWDYNVVASLLQQAVEACLRYCYQKSESVKYSEEYTFYDIWIDRPGLDMKVPEGFEEFSHSCDAWYGACMKPGYKVKLEELEQGFAMVEKFLLMNGADADTIKGSIK